MHQCKTQFLLYPNAWRHLCGMPLTPSTWKAGPGGSIITQPFHALCMALKSGGERRVSQTVYLSPHKSCSIVQSRCCHGNPSHLTMWKEALKGWGILLPEPYCCSWTAFKNSHCQVGLFSRRTTELLSPSLVGKYASFSRNTTHTKYLINSGHPLMVDSPCTFPCTYNTLICLTLEVSLHFSC